MKLKITKSHTVDQVKEIDVPFNFPVYRKYEDSDQRVYYCFYDHDTWTKVNVQSNGVIQVEIRSFVNSSAEFLGSNKSRLYGEGPYNFEIDKTEFNAAFNLAVDQIKKYCLT